MVREDVNVLTATVVPIDGVDGFNVVVIVIGRLEGRLFVTGLLLEIIVGIAVDLVSIDAG